MGKLDHWINLGLLSALLLSLLPTSSAQTAIATIVSTTSTTEFGNVVINSTSQGLEFKFNLHGLPPNAILATHVHIYGDISAMESEGGHFNPTDKQHGCAPNPDRHVGDLGELTTDAAGNCTDCVLNSTLASLDPLHPGFIIGRAIVIHASTDNCTGPAGFAGSRLAHGVIGVSSIVMPQQAKSLIPSSQFVCVLSAIGNSGISGNVTFRQRQQSDEIEVLFFVNGLQPQSIHGIHIHEKGDIEDNLKGLAVGSHFNPTNDPHGCPSVDVYKQNTFHTGDMGNHQANDHGQIFEKLVLSKPSMDQSSFQSILGRSVIVHSQTDNCVDVSSSGARLAQCVIGVSKERTFALDNTPMDVGLPDAGNASGWFDGFGIWEVALTIVIAILVFVFALYLIIRWRKVQQPSKYNLVAENLESRDLEGADLDGEEIELNNVMPSNLGNMKVRKTSQRDLSTNNTDWDNDQ